MNHLRNADKGLFTNEGYADDGHPRALYIRRNNAAVQ
jgi:hypothetical protein